MVAKGHNFCTVWIGLLYCLLENWHGYYHFMQVAVLSVSLNFPKNYNFKFHLNCLKGKWSISLHPNCGGSEEKSSEGAILIKKEKKPSE